MRWPPHFMRAVRSCVNPARGSTNYVITFGVYGKSFPLPFKSFAVAFGFCLLTRITLFTCQSVPDLPLDPDGRVADRHRSCLHSAARKASSKSRTVRV